MNFFKFIKSKLFPKNKIIPVWRVWQEWDPKPRYNPLMRGNGLLYVSKTELGTFEIYVDEEFRALLSFPSQMKKPAELFLSLQEAQAVVEEIINVQPAGK